MESPREGTRGFNVLENPGYIKRNRKSSGSNVMNSHVSYLSLHLVIPTPRATARLRYSQAVSLPQLLQAPPTDQSRRRAAAGLAAPLHSFTPQHNISTNVTSPLVTHPCGLSCRIRSLRTASGLRWDPHRERFSTEPHSTHLIPLLGRHRGETLGSQRG